MEKRDAINEVLISVNEMPLGDTDSVEDIQVAETIDKIIDIAKKKVLSYGWNFNTLTLNLPPDNSGYIIIPSTFLKVDPIDTSYDYVVRDHKLYDKENISFIFESIVECEVIDNIEFDDIPFVVADYITKTASVMAYASIIGSSQELNTLRTNMLDSRVEALRYEANSIDGNLLGSDYATDLITR